MEPADYGLKFREKEASLNDNIDKPDTKTDLQANKQTNKQIVNVVPISPFSRRQLFNVPTLLSEKQYS
jgi:hypothetical protein